METKVFPKSIRQLQRAEGYIELNLPERALAELNSINDPGPFEAAIALLRGEALKCQEKYDEAVVPLKQAATMIPSPLNKRAWRSLSECYRLAGRLELAEMADLFVNAEAPAASETRVIRVAVVSLDALPEAIRSFLGQLGIENSEPDDSQSETAAD